MGGAAQEASAPPTGKQSAGVVLNLYWSTDACVFSLGNVNICTPNSSLQLFSYLVDFLNVVQGLWGEGQCLRGILTQSPAGELWLQTCSVTFLLVRYIQLFSLFNILSSEVPELTFPVFRKHERYPRFLLTNSKRLICSTWPQGS